MLKHNADSPPHQSGAPLRESTEATRRHVFVVGLDAFNLLQLEDLPNAASYTFHPLLSFDEIKQFEAVRFDELVARAERQLAENPVEPDAIVAYWDFPATLLQAVLLRERGLPGPSLEALLKCEHKYWMRSEQREAGETDADFALINPFSGQAQPPLPFPFWLKPVKSCDSMLAFKIKSEADFESALAEVRKSLPPLADSFNQVLRRAKLPPEIAEANGQHCLAESQLSGSQHTVSGYIHQGRARTYAVVDSHDYPDSSSFLCYQYPSSLSEELQAQIRQRAERLAERIGLSQTAFNVEFFVDQASGTSGVLEINPRISQSHSKVFELVDGTSNEHLLIELALGNTPEMPHREGHYPCAAKYYLRKFEDAVVTRIPRHEELSVIERHYDARIRVIPMAGQRLSELPQNDSESYVLAEIFIGAEDSERLQSKFEQLSEELMFRFDAVR
ncbi:MAG: acetyl-CoA carboxylase biotin carboxylase subunit family protein [Opitutales bacterium]